MNPEQIRIAMAEVDGWKKLQMGGGILRGFSPERDNEHDFDNVPCYDNDLNAVHEVEKKILDSWQRQDSFVRYLHSQGDSTMPFESGTLVKQFPIVNATALQRCEAILRTLGKWNG